MKFSSIVVAAMASVMVVATPLAAPQGTTTNVNSANNVFARAECKQCSEWFDKCMRSWFCWLNPNACMTTCRREMCKAIQECRDNCPGDCPKSMEAAVEIAPVEAAVEIAPVEAAVVDTPAEADETTVLARNDCKKCDDSYNKCRGASYSLVLLCSEKFYWCWLNPYGCDVSCRADTCRNNGDECRNKCGYSC